MRTLLLPAVALALLLAVPSAAAINHPVAAIRRDAEECTQTGECSPDNTVQWFGDCLMVFPSCPASAVCFGKTGEPPFVVVDLFCDS